MASSSMWLMLIDQREATATGLVKASHAAFVHETYALQLHIETNPVAFRPSSVLTQLIQTEQRRGATTKTPQRQRTKNADYLGRKLESEVWQHYELESAQTCDKWKKLHCFLMKDRRQLQERIELATTQLCQPLDIRLPSIENDNGDRANKQSLTQDDAVAAEAERQRQLVESEWIHQERFNIQEAFTNQTKKIQVDYQAFMDQLDVEFIAERQKILGQLNDRGSPSVAAETSAKKKIKPSQLDRQFKSHAKRYMLVHTAPVVDVSGSDQASNFAVGGPRNKSDMAHQDSQLLELEQRLAAFKEAADGRLKDGMQWIARQCAHMFSQLDSKEAEATLVFMLTQQNENEVTILRRHVLSVA